MPRSFKTELQKKESKKSELLKKEGLFFVKCEGTDILMGHGVL